MCEAIIGTDYGMEGELVCRFKSIEKKAAYIHRSQGLAGMLAEPL
jgi:hypothetical protein